MNDALLSFIETCEFVVIENTMNFIKDVHLVTKNFTGQLINKYVKSYIFQHDYEFTLLGL